MYREGTAPGRGGYCPRKWDLSADEEGTCPQTREDEEGTVTGNDDLFPVPRQGRTRRVLFPEIMNCSLSPDTGGRGEYFYMKKTKTYCDGRN